MNDQLLSRRLLLFALPFIVALFLVTVSKHFNYTPDDTYIYLQFAKNIIHGNGVSFNPGEPTYGFTSPLWLLLIALSGRLGVDLYTAAKSLDLVFAGVALILFYLLANEVIRDAAVSICATVAFSLNIWFLRWTGTGMETSLSIVLLLASILFCLRNRYILSIIFAALLTLVRPETAFLAGLIVADLFVNSQEKRSATNLSVKLLLVYVAIVAPWLIYAFWYFQRLILDSRWSRLTYPAIFFLAAIIMLQNQVLYRRNVVPGIDAFQSGMEFCLIPIGRWLNEHTSPETIVYTPDIGAIGFFSERKICDGAGLISPSMLSLIRDGYTNEKMVERRVYESACDAHYVVDRSFEPERWKGMQGLTPILTRPFSQMGLEDVRLNYYTLYKVTSSQR